MFRYSSVIAGCLLATSAWAIDSSSWTCSSPGTNSCGNSTADGVVVDAPVAGTTGYAWVSTQGAPEFDRAKLPAGVPAVDPDDPTVGITNGATFTSAPFVASDSVSFQFNYVTSDGLKYADYAWARLIDAATGSQVALLFTARTHPTESVVPGAGMPPHQATLAPSSAPINRVAPLWAPLGGSSGSCYSSGGTVEESGCGYSGWIGATYSIPNPGVYKLEIGVVNWSDSGFDSGLAVDGLLVDGGVSSTLALNNPGTLPAQTAPAYKGLVADPGSSTTVDLLITGPNGYSETLQAAIQTGGAYSSQGAALPAGEYTVTATITGTSITKTETFLVVTAPPVNKATPVPTLGALGLVSLSSMLALLGFVRSRKRK